MPYPKGTEVIMFKKLVLKNNFHNNQATFRVEHKGKIEVDDVITLSASQIAKAKRLLCGGGDCLCSGELGARSDWHELDGMEVKLQENVKYGRDGKISGASLYVEAIW
jgi:hypothetical protein